jgi:hypothetical protein
VGSQGFSRRRFLGTVGVGALAAGTGLAGAGPRSPESALGGGFGRMFSLPQFAEDTPEVRNALVELGAPGGLLDAGDDLAAGPKSLFEEKYVFTDENGYRFQSNRLNPSNTQSEAGTTFLAQFVAHDVTFDATSPLGRPTNVQRAMNARTPALDLEVLYGAGSALMPHLYDPDNPAKLRIESGGRYEDLPRSANGTPLIADPRNDQTAILCGLHCAFIQFHNNAVDRVGEGLSPQEAFARAKQETLWHYQWLVRHELLTHVVTEDVLTDVERHGPRFFRTEGRPFVPVEFAAAAFRFGHSMVRPSYRLNFTGDNGKPFFAMTFDPGENGKDEPRDLRGGVRAERRFVDWQSFFDFGDDKLGPSKRIDSRISTTLFHLPLGAIPTRDAPTSLIQRDLLRHLTWQLPSGQAVAAAMGERPLDAHDLRELAPFRVGFERSTPLWYYVLKEAELVQGGRRLGPVGGRIVAETLLGLLQSDPSSYLRARPGWKPTFGGSDFGIVDFLTFAGVDPASRAA